MNRFRALGTRLVALFRRDRRDAELAAELESHLEHHIEDNLRAGMSPAEARRQALIKLGGLDQTKERYRERRGFPFIGTLVNDLHYGMRQLRLNPGFTLVAVLTIALGVGLNAGIFSILDALALRPITAGGQSTIFSVYPTFSGRVHRNVRQSLDLFSYPEYVQLKDENRVFSELAGYIPSVPASVGANDPTLLPGVLATCDYFEVLGVHPAVGRGLINSDCAAPGERAIVVISDRFWRMRLGSDPAAIGTSILLNHSSFQIVGIAPAGFGGTDIVPAEFWIPITMQSTLIPKDGSLDEADRSWMAVLGRLRPGVSSDKARADLAVIADHIARQESENIRISVQPATLLNDPGQRAVFFTAGAVILTAVVLVLLIACVNIANMLLARAVTRQKEIAIRRALGAGRARLIRQLLTESLVLALLGGSIGTALSFASFDELVRLVIAHIPGGAPPIVLHLAPDARVIAYCLALTLLTGFAFGLAPALQSSRVDVNSSLKNDAGGAATRGLRASALQNILVGGQIAVCLILLIASGLLLRGLYRAETIDPGFEMQHMAALTLSPSAQGYSDSQAPALHAEIRDRLTALPGVDAVVEAAVVPLGSAHWGTSVQLPGAAHDQFVEYNRVSANFFDVFRIPILLGRSFTGADVQSDSHVVILPKATAHAFWPNQDPVGKTLQVRAPITGNAVFQVIGVASDAQVDRLGQSESDFIYLPASPITQSEDQFMVHSTIGDTAALAEIRAAVRAIDPSLSFDAHPMTESLDAYRARSRIAASASGSLAILALLLGSIGVYGVVSFAISGRTREIGIRIALGANKPDILRLVYAQALRPIAVGVAVGIICSALISRVLSNALFGISPMDPVSFTLVPAFLLAVAALASYIPARRAMRVDPVSAIRCQ